MIRRAFLRRMALVALASGFLDRPWARPAVAAPTTAAEEEACLACEGRGHWLLFVRHYGAMATSGDMMPDDDDDDDSFPGYDTSPCGACRPADFLREAKVAPTDWKRIHMLVALERLPEEERAPLRDAVASMLSPRTHDPLYLEAKWWMPRERIAAITGWTLDA